MLDTATTSRQETIDRIEELDRSLGTVMDAITAAAGTGAFKITGVSITDRERDCLRALGYAVTGGKNNYTISWRNP